METVGQIMLFGGLDPPEGWFKCDGKWLPKTGYPELYGLLGTRFGGSVDHFALPHLTPPAGGLHWIIRYSVDSST